AEVAQLISEVDRVAKQSDFNGTKLLDGNFTSQLFQVGANAGQAIAINNVVNAKADSLGSAKFAADIAGVALDDPDTDINEDLAAENTVFSQLQVKVTDADGKESTINIDAFTVKQGESITAATAAAINGKLGETGVYAKVDEGVITLTSVKAGQQFELAFDGPEVEGDDVTIATAAA